MVNSWIKKCYIFENLLNSHLIRIMLDLTILFSLLSGFASESEAWYDPSWVYRKEITIDHTKVGADLTNFIILFSIIDSDLRDVANGGHVTQTDGGDILFTNYSGVKLNHEIERYNPVTGELIAWVEVDSLSSTTDTVLYIYYGGPSTPDQWNINGTWGSAYKMVQHLEETSGFLYDSTSNVNDGTSYGGVNQGIAGQIDGAVSFDGADDYIEVPHSESLNMGNNNFTVEGWIKVENGGDIIAKGKTGNFKVKVTENNKLWVILDGKDRHAVPSMGVFSDGTYLYITDTYNHRVVKRLASDLSYVSEIGSGGSGNDQFNAPWGIWGDGTYLYITDTNNNRVVKRLASDLSYVSQIGSEGTGNDNFNYPRGITGDGTYLYITDTFNNRVVKRLASDLSYVDEVGSEGTGNDQFRGPRGIWYDGTYLYITDTGNNRVVKRLASDLSYVSQIGSQGSGNDQFNYPDGIGGDSTHIYITDEYNHRVVKRRASDLGYVSKIGGFGKGDNQFNYPRGIWSDGTYIYITDPYNHRIVKRLASDLSYVSKIGSGGNGNDQFFYPKGAYSDGTYLYIADTGNHRVVKRMASDLSYVSQIGGQGSGNNQFDSPHGIYGDGTYIYIADTNNHRIVKRKASDLSYVSQIGSFGSGNDQFKAPHGIYGDGTYIYIADTNNHRIVKRKASDLSYVSEIGSQGSGNDQFNYPRDIWCDGTYIYIADRDNNRIVKRLASDLSYVSQAGGFASPRGICGDGTYLYISDTNYQRIVKRRADDLSYVSQEVGFGSGENQVAFPEGISCDGTYLYIADTSNQRIVKRRADDLSFVENLSSLYATLYSSSTLGTGWNHIAISATHNFPNVDIKIYINGNLDSQVQIPTYSYMAGTNDLKMGGQVNYFNGIIDEVRLYNRALSAEEILTIYNNTNLPFGFYNVGGETVVQYAVTVNATGNGSGNISSNPAGISYNYPANNTGSANFNHGGNIVLTANANTGSTASWNGTCTGVGGTEAGNDTQIATCTFNSLNGSKTITVAITLNQYTLTVNKTGTGSGTVTSNPAGINCGTDCTEAYNYNTVVTLTATPNAGSTFAGWSGDCTDIGNNQAQVTMDADKTCTATFNQTTINAPTDLTTKAISSSSIVLGWWDKSNNEQGFKIERKLGDCSSTNPWGQIATVGSNVMTYTSTGLQPNTTYSYRVRAYNGGGNSGYSNCASAKTGVSGTPNSPTGLWAVSVSSNSVYLTWKDNSNNETSFKIYRKKGSNTWTLLTTKPANAVNHSDTTATGNNTTAYSYYVMACNSTGCSPATNIAEVPYSAPTNLTATGGSGKIDLTWTDNSSNETGFQIYRKAGSCSSGGTWGPLGYAKQNVVNYSDTGLTAGQTYSYRVRAYKRSYARPFAFGYSMWSNCADAVAQ